MNNQQKKVPIKRKKILFVPVMLEDGGSSALILIKNKIRTYSLMMWKKIMLSVKM